MHKVQLLCSQYSILGTDPFHCIGSVNVQHFGIFSFFWEYRVEAWLCVKLTNTYQHLKISLTHTHTHLTQPTQWRLEILVDKHQFIHPASIFVQCLPLSVHLTIWANEDRFKCTHSLALPWPLWTYPFFLNWRSLTGFIFWCRKGVMCPCLEIRQYK